MFKKLKRKMLMLNLGILTVLLLGVLTAMYMTSYQNINRTINEDLGRMLFITVPGETNPIPFEGDSNLPNRSVSFTITIANDGTILNYDSNFGADDDFFEDAALLIEDTEGSFELDSSYWNYKSNTLTNATTYVFVDTSFEHQYLSNLLRNFILIFVGSFLVVYLISNYITKRSVANVKEAFNKQKEFVANASHELKTPLAIISTNADILLEEYKDNKWIGNIRYETDRMNKLTKDLLYLTKMSEQIPEEIFKTRTNLSELLESCILTFEALAYGKNIAMEYNISPEIFLELDPNQFSQVFHILLDNAIKYTPEDGHIYLGLESTHNAIVFSIENTGEGIKKEDLSNIFQRFYMGDKSRSLNEKSYGLGLSIAKTIVDNHQGKLYCESIEGEKTTFFIKLKNKTT